jgi:hypothetical protein
MLMGGAAPADAAFDVCKNVKVQVKNNRAATIKITSFDYDRDVAANNPKHEDINPDLVCQSRDTCKTNGDDLADSEGENLTNFVFFFNEIKPDGDVSKDDYYTQPKVPDDKRCTANRTYGKPGVNAWTIN